MQDVKTEVKGNLLTITVDLSQRRGISSTGKSELIVTASGKVPGHEAVRFGVNVYKVLPKVAA